jgi:ribosomal protein S18 acetylase RimI-like enzyme
MLMCESEYNIRTASYCDRSRLANLIHFGSYVHQHLDWKSPLDWIGKQPYLLIEKDDGLIATLACPPDLPEMAWIRLFAVGSLIKAEKAWKLLWEATLDEISRNGKIQVAALSMQGWFNEILLASKFMHTDDVIVLISEGTAIIKEPNKSTIKIRQMIPEDFPIVVDIDNSAFDLEWRNSLESLELAFQQSSYTTVAEIGDEIVGFQYSTSSRMGGHLARLAVNIAMQGKGIGYLLLYDLLKYFKQHGVLNVTVNTQQSNIASLALYSKAGFKTTGELYRVYQYINEM